VLTVTVPDPKVPDPSDVVDKGNDASSWLATMPDAFWMLVVCGVVAVVVISLLKRPFVRGLVVGGIALAIVLAMVM